MKSNNILPSSSLTEALNALKSGDFTVPEYAARTGELVAKYDREWQLAHNNGDDSTQSVCDFLTAVVIHVETLAQCNQLEEAVTTLIFGLLSVDISKVDSSKFDGLFVHANFTLALLLISLAERTPSSEIASHLDVCARYAIYLFSHAYSAYLKHGGQPVSHQGMDDLYHQFEQSGILKSLPLLHGETPDAESKSGEILVDILTRLRASGLSTI